MARRSLQAAAGLSSAAKIPETTAAPAIPEPADGSEGPEEVPTLKIRQEPGLTNSPGGAVLGGVLYYFTVSGMFRRLFEAVFRIFFKKFKLFLKILLAPALFLYKILISVFLRPFKNLFARRGDRNK